MKYVRGIFLWFLICTQGYAQYAEHDWEDRDRWMPVEEIFEHAGIGESLHVADIGCHEGYMSIHLANAVGKTGQVYAVDVRSDRLELLSDHLRTREIKNVKVIEGDYDNPYLPEGKLDVVLIIDTYHEMKDHKQILRHVHKALKPGGKLLILEKLKSRVRSGTRQEQTDAHTLAPKYVRKEMKAAKFNILKEVQDLGDWEEDSNKPMWLLLAEKADHSNWGSRKL
ncbi:MAG: class I SAM-dependent methyltransferase [Flavobacteriaceae bacterium]|nr:class I SAM-dependent methyltransferase [Flavobacteriaceae bacterium]